MDARISVAGLGGLWADSAGNSGTFVFNGNAAGGARPAPTVSGAVLTVGSIPGTAIANGAIGAAQVANGAIGNAQIANGAVSSVQTSNEPGVNSSFVNAVTAVTGSGTSYANVPMRVPADGFVKIEVTGQWGNGTAGTDEVFCQLQKGPAAAVDLTAPWFALRDRSTASDQTAFSAHRIVPVSVADNPLLVTSGQPFRLVCSLIAGAVSLYDVHISATYYATSYSPLSLVTPLDPPPPQ